MTKQCDVCGKKPSVGNNVSHSNRHTKRRFMVNLQTAVIQGTRKNICTSCMRTMYKTV